MLEIPPELLRENNSFGGPLRGRAASVAAYGGSAKEFAPAPSQPAARLRSRAASDGALALPGAGLAPRGASAAAGTAAASANDNEDEEEVDDVMLRRTLEQLARRQRTLAALRVQLAQAEHMLRDATEREVADRARQAAAAGAVEGEVQPGADAQPIANGTRKWRRTAATLRAAIGLLAPLPESIVAVACDNPSIESCVVDGWLQRLRTNPFGDPEWWRAWYCLRGVDGMLCFDDVATAAPNGHLPFDDSTTVESPIVRGPGDTGELMPRYAFRVRTGAGAMHTFACPPPSSEDDKARFDSHDWVQAIRTVVEQRTAPASASASPMATPMK